MPYQFYKESDNTGKVVDLTCSVCGGRYKAPYHFKFPLCPDCRWPIIDWGKEYWKCNSCGRARLALPGLYRPACCGRMDEFEVERILSQDFKKKFIKSQEKRGRYAAPSARRFVLATVGGRRHYLGYGNDSRFAVPVVQINAYSKTLPFLFVSTEEAAEAVFRLSGDDGSLEVKEVSVPENLPICSPGLFEKCPACGKCCYKHAEISIGINNSSLTYSAYDCPECGRRIAICPMCKTASTGNNVCSKKCATALSVEIERQRLEEKLRAWRAIVNFNEEPTESGVIVYAAHAAGLENRFLAKDGTLCELGSDRVLVVEDADMLLRYADEKCLTKPELKDKSCGRKFEIFRVRYAWDRLRAIKECPDCGLLFHCSVFKGTARRCSECGVHLRECVFCGSLCSSPLFCSDSCRSEDGERNRRRKEEEDARMWRRLEDFNTNPDTRHCFSLHKKGYGNVFLNRDGSESGYDRETVVVSDSEALLHKWCSSENYETFRVESGRWFRNVLHKCHKCGNLAFEEWLAGFSCGSCGTEMLRCADCGVIFPFTVGEQEFFLGKGFNPPKRCKLCRANRTRY